MDSGVGGDNAVDNTTLITVNAKIRNQPVEMIGDKSYLVTKQGGRMYGEQEGDLKLPRLSDNQAACCACTGRFLYLKSDKKLASNRVRGDTNHAKSRHFTY